MFSRRTAEYDKDIAEMYGTAGPSLKWAPNGDGSIYSLVKKYLHGYFPNALTNVIRSLFSQGEAGGMWLPGPDTCFTDTAGTTAAGVGDMVARTNDSSGNGNHATQATAAARPALGRTVEGGQRNLFTSTNFASGWSGFSFSSRVNSLADSAGGTEASEFTALDGAVRLRNSVTLVGGQDYRISGEWKRISGTPADHEFGLAGGGAPGFVRALTAGGTLLFPGTWNFRNALRESLGDGWERLSVTFTPDVTITTDTGIWFGGVTANAYRVRAGRLQIETGTARTDFQRVGASELDVTEVGKPELWYLAFDGIDDQLITGAIDYTATQQAYIAAGVRKNVNVGGVVLEHGVHGSGIDNGQLGLFAPITDHANFGGVVRDEATAISSSIYPVNTDYVVGLAADLDGATPAAMLSMTVNGQAMPGSLNGPAAAGRSFGNDSFSIGGRLTGGVHFNGKLYGLTSVSKGLNAIHKSTIDAFLAARSGVTL